MRVETMLPGTEPNVGMGAPSGGATPISLFAEAARRIEDWGFHGLTTPETGHDPFLPLAIAGEHTQRISLGTNVAIAFPRSPMTVAQAAWDLQRWSGGRLKLGIGTQVKGHNERRYSVPWSGPPGPRMREYVLCLRAIFQTFQNLSAPAFFEGQHYRFSLMTPFFNPGPIEHPQVPIYVSALNTYMARLAGELCDGLRLHPLSTLRYTEQILLPALKDGAEKAGRSPADVEVVPMPFIAGGRSKAEVEAAKAATRLHIAFYASTRTYHSVMEFHGWGDEARALHRLSIEGRWSEMGRLINDDMLREFAVTGTYDEIGSQIGDRWGRLCSAVFIPLPPGSDSDDRPVKRILRDLAG
jgi:probable F420-dependent oxidoreductase